VLVIPPPPRSEYYWAYQTGEYEYQNGVVNYHERVVGSYYDNEFAEIYCPNQEDRADIIATLNKEVDSSGGRLEIKGCSYSGYDSDIYVWVSSDNEYDWEFVYMHTITATSPYWIDFYNVERSFQYVRIVGYNSGNSVRLSLDCICVTP